MKQDNPKSPIIISDNVTISLEIPAADSHEAILLDETFQESQSAKSSRELYQLAEGEILSDGFYHHITEEEMVVNFRGEVFGNVQLIKERTDAFIELVKWRGEKDNILHQQFIFNFS